MCFKGMELDGLVPMEVDPSEPCPEAPPQPNRLIAVVCAEGKELLFLPTIPAGQISQLINQKNILDSLKLSGAEHLLFEEEGGGGRGIG